VLAVARVRQTEGCLYNSVQEDRAPLILSIDTTTDVRSVAVVAGAHVRAQALSSLRGQHSANLLGDIEHVLAEARVRLEEFDLFAAATGPGSFTGLRAGLATVKAFAAALNKPVVGVPTLHAVARAAEHIGHIVATLPAGRGELFAQLVTCEPDEMVTELTTPAHLPPAALIERALHWPTPLVWAGAGAQAQAELLEAAAARAGIDWSVGSDKMESLPSTTDEPVRRLWLLARPTEALAGEVAQLALRVYETGGAVQAEDLRALYVRLSDAELNERCRV
jgi:tRNA threonylcarbamoyladenosine biosynthesis protein TsaB